MHIAIPITILIISGLITTYFLLKYSSEKDDNGTDSIYHWKDDVRDNKLK